METTPTSPSTEMPARRERGGRQARRDQRAQGRKELGRPYILRNILTYNILGNVNVNSPLAS